VLIGDCWECRSRHSRRQSTIHKYINDQQSEISNLVIHDYHDGTKHHFNRFARSLGYLDWACQPNPFRCFHGAPESPLFPRPGAVHSALGDILRHSLGLSAWKQFRESRWSLRVNPSSGNLHPTEAYIVCGPTPGVTTTAGVFHYAADRHALERRCAFDGASWARIAGQDPMQWLVVLTSIHWRESWKYGERAFRYCQHDLGHAVAAVAIAAALGGHRASTCPDWSHDAIAAVAGLDRDGDYLHAEREEPGCILRVVATHRSPVFAQQSTVAGQVSSVISPDALIGAVRNGRWTGRANQLSEEHIDWTLIDDIARATRDPGRAVESMPSAARFQVSNACHRTIQLPDQQTDRSAGEEITSWPDRRLLLQRRSAVALDGRSSFDAERFFGMLAGVMPAARAPWDALWWDARIHLALFVHRVGALDPGLYVLVRQPRAGDALKAAMGRAFDWDPIRDGLPLFRLAPGDCRRLAGRVSCDQEIAADGFFSLGMLAEFDASVQQFGPSFYRHLFWEAGVVGQQLYLAAEAAGARGTGIGCFYDDPVHDVLGITGHAFQSLYHFTIGMPVEDTRLTTEPGYAWESRL
jgi:SagB-type dehydrogenase family enzyme